MQGDQQLQAAGQKLAPAKRRGRPPQGRALSNAERQRAFRQRKLRRLSLTSEELPKASMSTLLARLQDLVTHAKCQPWQATAVHQVLDELRRRHPLSTRG